MKFISRSKFFSRYLPMFLSVVLLVGAFGVYLVARDDTKYIDAAWYSSSWTYRKPITIDKNKLSTTATTTFSSFPLLFSVTDSDLKYTSHGGKMASSTAGDLLFTNGDGTTKLDFELESYSSSTGETIAWVRIPTLSASADTTIYVYFGNASATNQQAATSVWDSNFKGVWHLTQDPNGSAPQLLDSTTNDLDLTTTDGQFGRGGVATVAASPSKISTGWAFDTNNLFYSIDEVSSTASAITNYPATVSGWVRPNNLALGATGLFGLYKAYPNNAMYLLLNGSNQVIGQVGTNGVATGNTTALSDDTWYHLSLDWDGTTAHIYVNGALAVTSSISDTQGASNFQLGHINGTYGTVTGLYDELRISSNTRSADWIKTEYNNQNSPSTFYAYGSVGIQNRSASTAGGAFNNRGVSGIGWYDNSWTYRKAITIDKNKISTTATTTFSSFPLLFSVTDSDLKYTSHGGKMASSTAGDLLFTASDGITKLDFELEKYSSSTGETITWVRIPTLSAASDTTIFIYFGNASATSQQNISGVWDATFKGVWHLGEGDSTSANFYQDSTSNNKDGTLTDADSDSTEGTGKVGSAYNFNGDADFISLGNSTYFNPSQVFTVSFWANPDAVGSTNTAFSASSTNAGSWVGFFSNSANYTDFSFGENTASSWRFLFPSTIATNFWYTTITYNGGGINSSSSFRAYVNGQQSTIVDANLFGAQSAVNYIGAFRNATVNTGFFDGRLDEMRFAGAERSVDWIRTEYNNQNSPSTFYSYGSISVNGKQNSSGSSQPNIKIRGGVKFR